LIKKKLDKSASLLLSQAAYLLYEYAAVLHIRFSVESGLSELYLQRQKLVVSEDPKWLCETTKKSFEKHQLLHSEEASAQNYRYEVVTKLTKEIMAELGVGSLKELVKMLSEHAEKVKA